MPDTETLNKIQIEMLKQMINWGEYSYSYWYFDDIKINGNVVSKKELQSNMAELRKLELVKMYRGGLNEDGEVVGGTHFGIPYSKLKEVESMIETNL